MLIRSGARVALLAMLIPLVVACGKDKAATRPDEGRSAPVPVTMLVVQPSAWSDTLQAIGTAKARESVTLTSKVSEVVQDVHFESGDEVRAGAPLITLRGDSQRASLVEAQATFAEADRLYRRQVTLADQQLVARASLDTQKAIRDAAAARVQQTRSDIGDRNVRAPFAGVLGIRQVSPGALITPSTVIATLDDISRVYVDFPVPESQLANVANGQTLLAHSTSYPGRDFEGVVSTIDARIDAATRAVVVRGDFPNPDRALRPGMLMEVQLSRPERQALIVPEIALVQVGRDTFVYRVKADGSVEQAKVEVGARSSGKAEITQGIKAGERIVVDGTGKLRAGSKVVDGKAPRAQKPAAAKG
ncbi:efflux RND transporter periplasmic adaptor subunit [Pseudoxanthomonas gei]|uniref:Efflux RND transporter periplasmic adaptor subunit n=1 Tax=Pseudoxanthomonas gei TaxID=1383030 RepID=A0ABX0ABN6_9GAMM|nr:efflux RND transporter periplasmic adaptor subunit [Pseudoxanthomonas gei]NDK38298.1 efflux RND transporter periplasmic adaptor subunit [Pseudoxanthomonas gei]